MLFGGTILASAAYPILAVAAIDELAGGLQRGWISSALEGVDVQSFAAGTSASATSPSARCRLAVERATCNKATSLRIFQRLAVVRSGALFAGGRSGYSYTSQAYIRDYGIKNSSNRLGVVSGGILLNGIAKLALSKAFGPSQTYYDGTVTQTQHYGNHCQ